MDTAKQHWKILRQVPDELANRVRSFMVIGYDGEGVVMITEDGLAHWFGEMRFDCWNGDGSIETTEPTKLDVSDVTSMAHGWDHIVLLNQLGQLYTLGMNDCGQLGLGTDDHQTLFTPQLIPNPNKFTLVRCGCWHSLALTEDGKVWSWGANDRGQVGVPKSTSFLHPTLHQIHELVSHRIIAVECGRLHSLALTDKGDVYAWGNNDCGQLGHQNSVPDMADKHQHVPIRMDTTICGPVKSIAAGTRHTLLLTQSGEVWACGSNEFGQLGQSDDIKSSHCLSKIESLPSSPITKIAAHFAADLSIASSTSSSSSEECCYVWGELTHRTNNPVPIKLSTIDCGTIESVFSTVFCSRNTPYSVQVAAPLKSDEHELNTAKLENLTVT